MSVIAIGDVHGCLGPLRDLTNQLLTVVSQDDVLVFLGDYIDKGPDARACVDHIIALKQEVPCRVVALAGNHEHYMLRSWKDPTDHSWIWFGGLETIESYSPQAASMIRAELEIAGPRVVLEKLPINYDAFFKAVPPAHLEFFNELDVYYEIDEVICVHAGVDLAGSPMSTQGLDTFIWGAAGFPSEYRGKRPVMYGHWDDSIVDENEWPRPRILNGLTFGLDTISKGVLSAMRFPDRKLFQSRRWSVALR